MSLRFSLNDEQSTLLKIQISKKLLVLPKTSEKLLEKKKNSWTNLWVLKFREKYFAIIRELASKKESNSGENEFNLGEKLWFL